MGSRNRNRLRHANTRNHDETNDKQYSRANEKLIIDLVLNIHVTGMVQCATNPIKLKLQKMKKLLTRNNLFFSLVLTFTVLFDQITKILVVSYEKILPIHLMGDFFQIALYKNPGIAFSIPIPQAIIIPLIVIVATVGIYFLRHEVDLRNLISFYTLAVILGGTVGNLLDRALLGHVIDFIRISKFPVFNVADSAITCGIVVILIQMAISQNLKDI